MLRYDGDDYIEIWCVPSATLVSCIRRSQEKAIGLRVSLPYFLAVAYSGILFRGGGGGGSKNEVEDRGHGVRGSGGGSPLVRGSGGSCNLVQEISFHIVKFS
jgi:hypothetical protein